MAGEESLELTLTSQLPSSEIENENPPPPLAKESHQESESLAAMMEKEVKMEEEEEKRVLLALSSFKEESNKVDDLSDSERKALYELRHLVQEALTTHQFKPSSSLLKPEEEEKKHADELVSIWGIPLLKDERSDVVLLKFLRARDLKAKEAFLMIKNTVQWRERFGVDRIVEEELGDDWERVVFMHGHDREGHPVCYNVYGEFQRKEFYEKAFGDEEKMVKFMRWRIQFLERSIGMLDFCSGGVSTFFQVNDLRNSPGPAKRELRLATSQALHLLQDNYPEFVAKQVFVNVPWWYLAFYTMISPFLTQRTKSKFVFASPSKAAETLFKYISPEQVPIQYGGLSVDHCDCNPEFTVHDQATEITLKPGTKQTVEIIIYEICRIVWELRVVEWEVTYGAEFVPDAKDAYAIVIRKPTKMAPTDEPVVSHSFKVSELGKILLTIDNPTSKKKILLYRFKVKTFSE